MPKFCSHCGKQMADDDVFCMHCGTKFFTESEHRPTCSVDKTTSNLQVKKGDHINEEDVSSSSENARRPLPIIKDVPQQHIIDQSIQEKNVDELNQDPETNQLATPKVMRAQQLLLADISLPDYMQALNYLEEANAAGEDPSIIATFTALAHLYYTIDIFRKSINQSEKHGNSMEE